MKRSTPLLNAATLFSGAALCCILGVYLVFNFYLNSVSRELMSSWLQTEAVDIQEGNLLSSITKNQRILLSSQFVVGVTLFDTARKPVSRLIEIGAPIEPRLDGKTQPDGVQVVGDGFFRKQSVYSIPGRPGLLLIFEFESSLLRMVFFFTVAALLFFIIVLFGGIKVVQRREFAIEHAGKLMLGDLAAQVAHDIRGPAAAIQQILRQSTEVHGYREIQAELEQMQALARKLLRQYRGEESEAPQKFSLTELLQLTVKEAESVSAGKCEVHASVDDGVFVLGVRHDLSSALTNIVKNALEAVEPGRGCISISLAKAEDGAKIQIKDNGYGIPQDKQAGLFVRGATDKQGGTGLGLFQAKSVVTTMAGRITLSSAVGLGTTIEIFLPTVLTESPCVGNEDPEIVLIDDSPANQLTWSNEAERAGVALAVFESPEAFWAKADDFRRNTPIYVDYLFDGDPRGLAAAEKLVALGFERVFIATSFPREKILAPAKVTVVGKDFPFDSRESGRKKHPGEPA